MMLTETEIAAMKERNKDYPLSDRHDAACEDRHKLLLEREEILKDKERLDWVEKFEIGQAFGKGPSGTWQIFNGARTFGFGKTAREAIDAAMAKEKKERNYYTVVESRDKLQEELTAAQARVGALEAMLELPDDLCIACGGTGGHFEGCTGTTGLIAMQARVKELEQELQHISTNLCGVKVEGDVTFDMVYHFVEGQIEKQAERANLAEQAICDFQAASMIDVGNQGGPCRVEPRDVEKHVTELRERIATLEQALRQAEKVITQTRQINLGVKVPNEWFILRDKALATISNALNEKEGR